MTETQVVQVATPEPQQQQQPQPQPQQQVPWYRKNNGSLPLGSCIGGIPIYLHWSFFLLLGLMLVSVLFSHATDGSYWLLILLLYGKF